MRRLFFTLMLLGSISTLFAQDKGHNIEFNIEGCKTGNVVLAYYYGNKQYIKDSTKVDNSGKFVFKNDEALDQGIYIVVLPPDNKYFEVIIDGDQQFSMNTKYDTPVKSMTVTGNEENARFYTYLQFLNGQKKKSEPLSAQIKELEAADSLGFRDSPEFKKIQVKLTDIDQEVKDYKGYS